MFSKLSKFLDVANVILQIWLYKLSADKDKKDELKKLGQEADIALKERRYNDAIVIWNRMRLIR